MRSPLALLPCLASIVAAGCYCSHGVAPADAAAVDASAAPADAAIPSDAAPRVRVTGCDDPRVWTAPVEEVDPWVQMGGGPCSPPQYPLHVVGISGSHARAVTAEERSTWVRSCWRVLDAHDGSGWRAGDAVALDSQYGGFSIIGFERPVTFEGRVLRDDDTVAFAVRAATVELDPARRTAPGGGVVAVMSDHAWAERDAVHLWGETVATAEVVDGAAGITGTPVTLHRDATGYTLRYWTLRGETVSSNDLAVGESARPMLARGGRAVALDDELLVIGSEDGAAVVRHRIPLGAEPLELVGRYYYVVAHVPGELIHVRLSDGAVATLPVGAGTLLSTEGDSPPAYFDGAAFMRLEPTEDGISLDERWVVRPAPEDLAALGRPLAVRYGVVLGEGGFLLTPWGAEAAGPRSASLTEVGGARLTHVSDDGATYAFERTDGTTDIHHAPFVPYCE